MTRCRFIHAILVFATLSAWADTKQPAPGKRQPMTQQTRFYVIRGLQSELAFARKPLPLTVKGLTLHEDGSIAPSQEEIAKELATAGPAARPGDRVRLTNVVVLKNAVVFEINGGPKKKKKWYEHVQVGMANANINADDPKPENPHGTVITLQFKDYVPEITPEQLKQMLSPLLDFSSRSAVEAYLDTIPPKAKEAIKNHQVLVGMDQEMVGYAKGRPQKRIRETDSEGKPYEEWIYGAPPEDVEFVRFQNSEVVRLEIMKVGGEKTIRTEKEVDLKEVREAEARKKEQQPKPQPVANRPTLRRPGEEEEAGRPGVPRDSGGGSNLPDPSQRDPSVGPPVPRGPSVTPSPPAGSPGTPSGSDPGTPPR
jgi:hypothetical protein